MDETNAGVPVDHSSSSLMMSIWQPNLVISFSLSVGSWCIFNTIVSELWMKTNLLHCSIIHPQNNDCNHYHKNGWNNVKASEVSQKNFDLISIAFILSLLATPIRFIKEFSCNIKIVNGIELMTIDFWLFCLIHAPYTSAFFITSWQGVQKTDSIFDSGYCNFWKIFSINISNLFVARFQDSFESSFVKHFEDNQILS